MEYLLTELSVGFVAFLSHTRGIITHPYQTYRRIVEKGRVAELCYIGLLCAGYFAVAALVKTAAFRPFLLTRQFVLLSLGALLGYIVCVGVITLVGKVVGGKGSFRDVAVVWGYTLFPTGLWFLSTSLLYVILPPPRTSGVAGVLFSFLYLVFSAVLFFWKAELYYLTLRFALRLDLLKILLASCVILPVMVGLSMVFYWAGIFKVPFI